MSSDVTFHDEGLVEFLESDPYPLFRAHFEEVGMYREIDMVPNLDAYHKLEGLNKLRIYTIRSKGLLAGYSVYMMDDSLHHKGSIQARHDLMYISPDLRGYAISFFNYCHDALKLSGCDVAYMAVNPQRNFSRLLEFLGYNLHEFIFSRRL